MNIIVKNIIKTILNQSQRLHNQNSRLHQMNLSYQHKKGPPKMIKDLKFGMDAHLRQSLLDITEIENLNKIFVGRKTHYRIDDANNEINSKQKENPKNEESQIDFSKEQFVLSPEENLELIKRQRITNKMKDKLNQMFRQQQVRKYKLRKPILHNMLSDFKESYRVEQQLKLRQVLKNSQKQLEHIKINSKKRVSSQHIRTNTAASRTKFLSITTSKPTVNKNYFPTFRDFVKGKYKFKEKAPVSIDINKIDNYFQTMITQPILTSFPQKKSSRDQYLKQWNRQPHSSTPVAQAQRSFNHSSVGQHSESASIGLQCSRCKAQNKNKQVLKCQATISSEQRKFRNIRSKSAANPNLSFNRSEESSKRIISAMQTYYSSKKQKNHECDTIVQYMKKDRPLTSHLRRKNYTVVGHPNIQDLDKYRQKSEEQRVKLLQKNYNFYISLLRIFEHCKEEEIETSLKILERMKQFFESQYVLFQEDAARMCQLDQGEKTDFGVRIIRQNLMEFAKKQHNFNTDNQQDYEML